MADAKKFVTGSFALRLTTIDAIASMMTAIQINDLGIDYIKEREALLNSVTVDDVMRVAARLLDVGKLSVVVVGDPDDLEGTIEEQG